MNRLQYETSPYLLQHKHNPVDWYPWSTEALNKAVEENKPILLSIGYSSCHWCHVMEHESFEDSQTAAYMNQYFVNIKLDREERPDLDKIYMDAVQVLTGSGGWPLNCFLLPDKRPFFGGTYFPPLPMHQRPSWMQVLQHIQKLYSEKREVLETQALRLTDHIKNAASTLIHMKAISGYESWTNSEIAQQILKSLISRFDKIYGGFGSAPKFPSTMTLKLLLDIYFFTGQKIGMDHVFHTLNQMSRAGIYDQIRGGFARYATDAAWDIPHFEKMLYDNAQLIQLYSQAYKISPKNEYKQIVFETVAWLQSEMESKNGGFYSAIDADSEGVEGKFYVWTYDELKSILNENEWALAIKIFLIEEQGNWEEEKIILRMRDESLVDFDVSLEFVNTLKKKLLDHRNLRIRPLTDTKIILAWNALACKGLIEAYDSFGEKAFLDTALKNLLLIKSWEDAEGRLSHQKDSKIPAMLDDMAFYIEALLMAYRSTSSESFLDEARKRMKQVLEIYFDKEKMIFHYSISPDDLIARVPDYYDSTMPSGVASLALSLAFLDILDAEPEYKQISDELVSQIQSSILRYPESLSYWASILLWKLHGNIEIKIQGPERNEIKDNIMQKFIPFPILSVKEIGLENEISFCHNFTCDRPVNSFQEFLLLLKARYHISNEN